MIELFEEIRSKIIQFFIFSYISGNIAWLVIIELLGAVTYPMGGWSSVDWENALRPFSHISMYKSAGIPVGNGSVFLDENGKWRVRKD